ncbi:MAG: hypothetical protein ACREBZ_06945 [Thermoplasmata archaeon]
MSPPMLPRPPERETRFPALLVGAAVVLALLIVLTPVLINGGGAGTFLTQAEVVVDHPPGGANTTFAIRGVGAVRYSAIDVGVNDSYASGTSVGQLGWNSWWNQSEIVGLIVTTGASSVALRFSVGYVPAGSSTVYYYYGVLAAQYNAAQGTLLLTSLAGGLSVPTGPISVSSSDLPLIVPLEYLGAGSPP